MLWCAAVCITKSPQSLVFFWTFYRSHMNYEDGRDLTVTVKIIQEVLVGYVTERE